MTKGPPRHCIYCNAQGSLTKEHIFGDWLKAFIPQDITVRTEHTTSKENNYRAITEVKAKGKLSRQGKPHRANLRIVCESCNNGWMSRLQHKAKPTLVDVLEGKWPNWDAEKRLDVASWETMASMTLEFADAAGTRASTKQERRYLMDNQKPPSKYYIYVGFHNTIKETGSFFQRSAKAYASDEEAARSPVFDIPNIQATTFFYGKGFFHVISCTEDNISFNPFEFADWLGIRILWPLDSQSKTSRPFNFTKDGVNRVATEFFAKLGIDKGTGWT